MEVQQGRSLGFHLAGDLGMDVDSEKPAVKVRYELGWEEHFQEAKRKGSIKQFSEKRSRGGSKDAGKGK